MNHNILHSKSLNKYCPLALLVVMFVFTGCKTCDCPSYAKLHSDNAMLYNIIAGNILSVVVFNNEKSYQQRKKHLKTSMNCPQYNKETKPPTQQRK